MIGIEDEYLGSNGFIFWCFCVISLLLCRNLGEFRRRNFKCGFCKLGCVFFFNMRGIGCKELGRKKEEDERGVFLGFV